MPSAERHFDVVRYEPALAATWKKFLLDSDNGTLFHDLDFLAYHPPGKFEEHHLLFYRGGALEALLPAAIVLEPDGKRWLKSPYGASVGGLVHSTRMSPLTIIALCEALQQYAVSVNCAGIEMRLAPGMFNERPGDELPFALAARGFNLTRRWLSPIIRLPASRDQALDAIPTSKRRSHIRCSLRRGATLEQAGLERLEEFYQVLEANRARHSARPTHTLAELRWLMEHLPEQIRLFVCALGEQIIGGTVMFDLNKRVTYSFYTCHDEAYEEQQAPTITLFRLIEEYAGRGFRFLDLGPTGSAAIPGPECTMNTGGAFFKNVMGGVGVCRDTWRWKANGE